MTFVTQNNLEDPPVDEHKDRPDRTESELDTIIPENLNKPYDMKSVIHLVVDDGDFFEVHEEWGQSLIVGFARLNGRPIGLIANQPAVLAGVLSIDSSQKGARFIRFCDCFNIPIVTFEDVPGFMPGTDQECGGSIKQGAKLLYAYCEATVPKITVITRKAYVGAYDVMNSKHIRGDINYAWPTAEIAVMGPKGAVEIIFKREIEKSKNPEETVRQKEEDYRNKCLNPYIAAEWGYIDDIIEASQTRPKLISALEMLKTKVDKNPKKKHGNIPL